MLFTSFAFYVLVLATLTLYYLPAVRRWQTALLVLASFVFYGSNQPWLVLLLALSCAINAGASYAVAWAPGDLGARVFAVVGVAANLGLLAFFKYAKLLAALFVPGLGISDPIGMFILHLPLPIGISFFTFQGISLVVDTFRGRSRSSWNHPLSRSFLRHLLDVSFFKSFFPQLVAGPIVKAHEFLPQIRPKFLDDVNWLRAFRLLILGYFLKAVVADNLNSQTAFLTGDLYYGYSSVNLIALLFGYSAQIFADFAGYSLIAQGVAELFGYRLPENFRFPYLSRSLSEFWTRWHISLSSWLREYLYVPLGGNRKGRLRTYGNLLVVMVLGGLWHGAGWNYALWGAWHGVLLVLERALGWNRPSGSDPLWVRAVQTTVVFLVVSFAWLLFKLPTVESVLHFLWLVKENWGHPVSLTPLAIVAVYSLPVIAYHVHALVRPNRPNVPPLWEAVVFGVMAFMIATNSGASSAFIYFQF
uniref:SpaI n=1 Tax=Spirochaeta aurantia TaxID=147 RepID=Q0PHZ9_SPIAU|nr:SpaI [Spirochaeta aurantia]